MIDLLHALLDFLFGTPSIAVDGVVLPYNTAIWPALIAGAASIGSALINKSGSGGGGGIPIEPLNIDDIDRRMRELAMRNLQEGRMVEQMYRPEFAQMRGVVDQSMLDRARRAQAGMSDQEDLRQLFLQGLQAPPEELSMPELERSALLQDALAQAREELSMGGALPREIQNAVTRAALAGAGQSGLEQGVAGRDIVARDLGLTGLDLRNQRLNRAAQLGELETGINVGQQALRDSINRANVALRQQKRQEIGEGLRFLEDLGFRDFTTATQAAMGTPLPQLGLDPGSFADMIMADRNARMGAQQQAAAINAQNRASRNALYSSALGAFGQALGNINWGGLFNRNTGNTGSAGNLGNVSYQSQQPDLLGPSFGQSNLFGNYP